MLLKFVVNQQIITRLDKNTPVSDSKNYLKLAFTFSKEWTSETKIVIFNGSQSVETTNDWCYVPEDVLKDAKSFTISVYQGDRITTNTATINILPSGYVQGLISNAPTLQDIINYSASNPSTILKRSVVTYDIPTDVPLLSAQPPRFVGLETLIIRGGELTYNISFIGFFDSLAKGVINIYVPEFTGENIRPNQRISIQGGNSYTTTLKYYFTALRICPEISGNLGTNLGATIIFGKDISQITSLANYSSMTYCFPFSQVEAPDGYPYNAPNAKFVWNYTE